MFPLLLLFLTLFLSTKEIIPLWNLDSASEDILPTNTNTNTKTYTITHREMYNLIGKLEKTITRDSEGKITHKNTLYLTNKDETYTKTIENVNFEQIESLYKFTDRRIVCPLGKHHPIIVDDTFQEIDNADIDDNNEWDMKCYNHNEGYFFVYYFMNGEKQIYKFPSSNTYNLLNNLVMHDELYDFELVNKDDNQKVGPYHMCALIKNDGYITFFASQYKFGSGSITRDIDQNKPLCLAKNHTQGYFNNYTDHFYFITYNDVSDFVSGYSTVANEWPNLYTTSNIKVNINEKSPFEFSDKVEIKEMKFLLYTNYVYYAIYNIRTRKTYHGILDVKLNQIVFNTDEDIDTFIPYSNISMLAITKTSAYKICIIPDSNNNCLEKCSSGNLVLDVDGNYCSESCKGSKYILLPEKVCISNCNSTIYVLKGTNCGLCRDLETEKKYKIINSNVCLSQSEIPVNSEVYNSDFYLLKCKSGYQLSEDGKDCIPHCYTTCETCSDYSENENDQKCLTCNNSYYLESEKCILKQPSTIIIPVPIIDCPDEKCLTCSEESNKLGLCLTCNEAEGYKKVNYTIVYPQFLNCIKPQDPKYKSYYFNEALQEYRPCYKTCKRCLKAGNAEENNCLECDNGYMFRPGNNTFNNCVAYSQFYFMSSYNQFKSLEIYQCPEEAKYYIRDKKSCIDNCQKDEEYKYLYNGNCLKECPSGTSNNNYICKADSDKCVLGINDIVLAENDNLEIIGTLVKSYIAEFYYTELYISKYENQNYTIFIYKEGRCIKELNLLMPNVNFKDCYTKVQNEYGINEKLIIVIVNKNINNLLSNPLTFYSFYHPKSGEKLDADRICKDDSIIVVESLNSFLNKNSTYYETQTSLTSQGINIFDLNDPFYKDICFDFDNPLKKDIPLNDRIKYIYPEADLCDKGCSYKGINLDDMTTTCDCKFNDIANSNIVKDNELIDSAFGEIFDLINSSNILVLKCFKNIFTHFSRSIGGWISLVLICAQGSMVTLFFLVGFSNVKKYLLCLTNNYISYISNKNNKNIDINTPPKRNFIRITNIKNRNIINKNIINKNKNVNQNLGTTNSEADLKNNERRKSRLNPVEIPQYSKDDIIINFQQNYEVKESDKNLVITNNTETISNQIEKTPDIDPEKYNTEFFKEYMSTPLDELEFDDAVALDKRKYCEHMKENMLEDQIIANTFIAEDPIKPRSIKIMLFILNVILYFVVNGLFFSEEVISELYNVNEEDENFFSYFPRSIERLIYTTLVSIIVGIIADFFFTDETKIRGIFRRDKENFDLLKENISIYINDLKKRYFAFISVVSIVLIISFFYLLCFNYVYPYSQIEWVKSSITIMIIMQILSVLKCFLETSMRFLSYKFRNEKLYKICKFLD